jgi:hypothetical protein
MDSIKGCALVFLIWTLFTYCFSLIGIPLIGGASLSLFLMLLIGASN